MTTALHLPPPWPEDDAVALRRMFLAGLSYAEIATRLGRSKGEVSGKINRMRESLGFRQARAAARNRGRVLARLHCDRTGMGEGSR